jgi:hypothetical protein
MRPRNPIFASLFVSLIVVLVPLAHAAPGDLVLRNVTVIDGAETPRRNPRPS